MNRKNLILSTLAAGLLVAAVTVTPISSVVTIENPLVITAQAASTLSASTISGAYNYYGKVMLTYTLPGSATGVKIYRSTSKSGTYTCIGSSTTSTYYDTSVSSGTTYYYKVVAYNSSTTASASAIKSITYLSCPTISAVTNQSGGVKVSWSKSTGASKYYVYRAAATSSSYTLIATTTSTSYTDSSVTSGKGYTYKIVAVSNGGAESVGSYSTSYYVAAPAVSSLTAGTSKMTVKWNSISVATGYQVQYSTSSSFSTYKTVNVTSTSKAITGLTSGTTYYFRVRSYMTVSSGSYAGTYYSAWSSAKSKTVN